MHLALSHAQDFNPDDFLGQSFGSEEGVGYDSTKFKIAGLMASSHLPYILNRLNMSISNTEEEGELTLIKSSSSLLHTSEVHNQPHLEHFLLT